VSVFSPLAPQAVPADFAGRLPAVLDGMEAAGLLTRLPGDPGDPLGDLCLLGEELEGLCQGLGATAMLFGLCVSRLVRPEEVERATIGGWRTAGGLLVADLSEIESNKVHLCRMGPRYFRDLLAGVLRFAERTVPPASGPSPSPADLLRALQGEARVCPGCGAPVEAGWAFCGACRQPLPAPAPAEAPQFCAECGAAWAPGASFCAECGRPQPKA
jgi:hypothetical protein